MFLLFVLLTLLFSINQTEALETKLEEIVVTATRVEEPKRDLPYSVQVITQEDIKTSVAKDAGDLIAESAIGHITKYPEGLTTFYLRGFGLGLNPLTSRSLILINGLRTATINLSEIPVDDIERIEILKGPASVLYGSNAMGGVVNIITKRAKREGLYGSIGIEGGSWGQVKAIGEINFKKSAFDGYLSLSRTHRDDYEAKGIGEYKNTAYDDQALSLRLGYEVSELGRFSLGFRHFRGWDIGSPGSLKWQTPRDHIDISLNSFDLGFENNNLRAFYYLSERKYEYHDDLSDGWGGVNKYKTLSQGISIQKIFNIDKHRVIIGGEWNRVDLKNTNEPPPAFQPRSQFDNLALFVESKLVPIKDLTILLGVRYDYFENSIKATESMIVNPRTENSDHITVRVGTLYRINDELGIRASVGTGFRAPSPDEYAGEYLVFGTRYIGNPSLSPEKVNNYEVGLSYNRENLKGDFTFFHSIFKDRITNYFDSTLNAFSFKNIDKAKIQGAEISLSYDLRELFKTSFSLEPYVNLTYHTKYSDSQGNPILAIPKWIGAFGIKAKGESWDARLVFNYFGDENVLYYDPMTWTSRVVKKQDFTIANFKALYRPIKELELTVGIENLFDRAYEYVLDYPMARRTFTAGVKWLF